MERLKEDHEHAKQIAAAIAKKDFVQLVLPVETNIIIFELKDGMTAPVLVNTLKEKEILCYAIAPNRIRLVLHLDITKEMVSKTINIIKEL
jgi:threonine aldolase